MSLFKKLLKIIAIILVIIAIVYFLLAVIAWSGPIAASDIGYFALNMTGTIGWGTFALIGFGLVAVASVLSPEGVEFAVARVSQGISTVAENVVDIAGNVVSKVTDEVLGSPYVLLGTGVALWYLFGRGSDRSTQQITAQPREYMYV
jgi:hypothetical protein